MVYPGNTYGMGSICLTAKEGQASFLFLQSYSGLPLMLIQFCSNVYSIINMFSFTTILVERIWGLEDLISFNFPTRGLGISWWLSW